MAKVVKPVSFDHIKHAALLARIDELEPGTFSETVRVALLAYFGLADVASNGVSLDDIYQSVQRIEGQLAGGLVRKDAGEQNDDVKGVELRQDEKSMFD